MEGTADISREEKLAAVALPAMAEDESYDADPGYVSSDAESDDSTDEYEMKDSRDWPTTFEAVIDEAQKEAAQWIPGGGMAHSDAGRELNVSTLASIANSILESGYMRENAQGAFVIKDNSRTAYVTIGGNHRAANAREIYQGVYCFVVRRKYVKHVCVLNGWITLRDPLRLDDRIMKELTASLGRMNTPGQGKGFIDQCRLFVSQVDKHFTASERYGKRKGTKAHQLTVKMNSFYRRVYNRDVSAYRDRDVSGKTVEDLRTEGGSAEKKKKQLLRRGENYPALKPLDDNDYVLSFMYNYPTERRLASQTYTGFCYMYDHWGELEPLLNTWSLDNKEVAVYLRGIGALTRADFDIFVCTALQKKGDDPEIWDKLSEYKGVASRSEEEEKVVVVDDSIEESAQPKQKKKSKKAERSEPKKLEFDLNDVSNRPYASVLGFVGKPQDYKTVKQRMDEYADKRYAEVTKGLHEKVRNLTAENSELRKQVAKHRELRNKSKAKGKVPGGKQKASGSSKANTARCGGQFGCKFGSGEVVLEEGYTKCCICSTPVHHACSLMPRDGTEDYPVFCKQSCFDNAAKEVKDQWSEAVKNFNLKRSTGVL